MTSFPKNHAAWLLAAWLGVAGGLFPAITASAQSNVVTVLEREGLVEAARAGTNTWTPAEVNQALHVADRVRTGERSRATLHLLDQSTLRMAELTEFLIEPLTTMPEKPSFSLSQGLLYFFHRDKPVDVEFKTRLATAAIRGTEFNLSVARDGRTVLTMFDGVVDLTNDFGAIRLKSGEQGVVEPGRAPVKTPVINAINIIQWCLYYPGVLDVDELNFSAGEQSLLQDSLAAYRAGDLLAALGNYPKNHQPDSAADKIYHAALLLAVGKVAAAQGQLADLPATNQLAAALCQLIATVKHEPAAGQEIPVGTNSATALLVQSYQWQGRARLPEALQAAERAVAIAPGFAFGWARVAELEFSFGHTRQAQAALAKSLALAPRNAEAVALQGFTLAAQNQTRAAMAEFDRAIALDGALGNAWLGRGLCRIRRGNLVAGRDDLQVAATLEPQRALFRSYLGKAWTELGDSKRAAQELALARERDPGDPTAWLYSALLLQQDNRINEGIGALEESQALNDNRRVYRSRLLLDQDRAVGGANLANLYRDDGMTDVGVQEAVNAVNADYANYSAHLFLADSFNDLRDPQGVNLRYETPYLSEYLVANLLAPVGAGTLSQSLSQQEYAKMFESDGVQVSSSTIYTSHGDLQQSASQSGTFGNSSFAAEEFYNYTDGYRPNSDLENTEYDFQLKHQLTPQDSVFLQVTLAYSDGGNTYQYYNQAAAAASPYRFEDRQDPIVIAGFHHEWSPGSHLLVLAGHLRDVYSVTNPTQDTLALGSDPAGTLLGVLPFAAGQNYRSVLDIYTVEAQQIFETPQFTTILGSRFQDGGFDTSSQQYNYQASLLYLFQNPVIANQDVFARFQRLAGYAYEQWQAVDSLKLVGGVNYERLVLPVDFRYAPLSAATETRYYLLPKAGMIWTPQTNTTLRAAYSESVGGASFDQSFQLEPTEVAGFNQAYRSLIPESVAGANSGERFTSYGVSLEQRFRTRTYVILEGDLLRSRVNRSDGAFDFIDLVGPYLDQLDERLEYEEKSVSLSAHQLVGRDWALGAAYRWSQADLTDDFPGVSPAAGRDGFVPLTHTSGILQTVNLDVIYQHPSGLFAQLKGVWTGQENQGYTPAEPGANYWQCDVLGGYRFHRRQAEIRLGVLNLTGTDYQLNPLNLHEDTPRRRTFFSELQFNF